MIVETFDLNACLARARSASRKLASAKRNDALYAIAEALEANLKTIIAANQQDVAAETARGTKASLIDRLTLSETRLSAIADSVRQIAQLPDPLFRVLDGWRLENGLHVQKVTVPFGVIGMIYESRPNVTVDAAVLTLKAGSSVVLRGSSNALASNRVLVKVMREAIATAGLPADAIQLIDSPERALVTELLESRGQVDLVIPRGGAGLIQHVVNTAKVPTIETGIGNCHLFVDASADLDNALEVTLNAKVQRPGVCNAIETLLVHRDVTETFLPKLADALTAHRVTLHGCEKTCQLIPGALPATTEDWQTEYLDYELAIRVVDTLDDAIEHITTYGSMHSEAILTRDMANARRFQREVDAAAVYVNASTRFTDGFELGFGAEIGISTQKLHARGPMGLAEMVTYKYLIEGDGQIRA
jgi:glutamate-5-semialdehyde dehydrogenase